MAVSRAALLEAFYAEEAIDEGLRAKGFIDDNGLTPAGELKLLQLKTVKWLADNPREQRGARKRRTIEKDQDK